MTSTEDARARDRGVIKSIGIEPSAWGPLVPLEPGPSPRAAAASRGRWAYRKAALIHPSNLIALAAVLMLGLINPSGQIVLLGLGAELLFLVVAPRSQWLRRCLDEGYVEAVEAARTRAREALIAKMSESHRDELARLDDLVKTLSEGERERERGSGAAPGNVDWKGLTASYIRLSLAHKACEDALALSEQRSLRASFRALSAAAPGATPRVRAAIRERLAVAEERMADEARVREDLDVINHELATIADIIYLRHQQAVTLGPSAEAARFIQDFEATRSVERELADLTVDEGAVIQSMACA
jgi:hypothetical protein